jgi:hypothetical protein
MSRIFIVSNAWEAASDAAFAFAITLASGETEVVTIRAEQQDTAVGQSSVSDFPLPFEPPHSSGFLFGLRNAIFFGTAANPANYAMLRDRLHMHLQDVHYHAVLILCPPRIYLRIGAWIHATFGIPVWVHLEQPLPDHDLSWYNRRLQRKYLAAAKVITAATATALSGIRRRPGQSLLLATANGTNLSFSEPETGLVHSPGAILERIIRNKQHS